VRGDGYDVSVGVPRCGCAPEDAGGLARLARDRGLQVRGVMGYEGHVMLLPDRDARAAGTTEAMRLLGAAHADVGGELVSAGGTRAGGLKVGGAENQARSDAPLGTAPAQSRPPLPPPPALLPPHASGFAPPGAARLRP